MKLIYIPISFSFLQLVACSYLFPDKEKDYVYSKQLSALEVPPELPAKNKLPNKLSTNSRQSLTYKVALIIDPEQTFLQINSSFAHVWRIVGKALTEVNIDVTDKNRDKALYYVQYDPEVHAAKEDGSYWQELVFMFDSDIHQELPYHVFLTTSEQGIRIFVRDKRAKILSNGKGLQLLKLIFTTINKDIAKKTKTKT
jgi:outer membrane protein assembly factor BamC